ALGVTAAQLDRQVKADAVARIGLKLGLSLDDGVVVGADELALEVGLFGLVYRKGSRPLLCSLRIAEGNDSLTHRGVLLLNVTHSTHRTPARVDYAALANRAVSIITPCFLICNHLCDRLNPFRCRSSWHQLISCR